MSNISYTSGQLEHKQQLLDEVNRAVLTLQADALGLRAAMHVDDAAVERSRRVANNFAVTIEGALEGQAVDPIIAALVVRMVALGRPDSDWLNDLRALRNAIVHGHPIPAERLMVLAELVCLVDREFTEDLYRLYGRR
jgi:hypothetical protein